MQMSKDHDQERLLWQIYWQQPSLEARNRLIEFYYPQSSVIAKHYYRLYGGEGSELDDFIQEAQIALSESIERFKVDAGASFLTFASYRIRGRILNSLKFSSEKASYYDYQRRSQQQRRASIGIPSEQQESLSLQSVGELIIRLAYTELLDGMAETAADSFNEQPIRDDDDSLNNFANAINPYRSYVIADIKTSLKSRVKQLPRRQRQVIELHYYGQFAFDEIGLIMSVSKTRVSQLHKQAIEVLRNYELAESAV